jgi:hypothetical protein
MHLSTPGSVGRIDPRAAPSAWMQSSPATFTRRSRRTRSGRVDRPRAESCFALAEGSSDETAPAYLVLVRSERMPGATARPLVARSERAGSPGGRECEARSRRSSLGRRSSERRVARRSRCLVFVAAESLATCGRTCGIPSSRAACGVAARSALSMWRTLPASSRKRARRRRWCARSHSSIPKLSDAISRAPASGGKAARRWCLLG